MTAAVARFRYSLARRIWTRAFARLAKRRSILLGYHGISKQRFRDDPSLLQVPPERFRMQLELLRDAGFRFVTVSELVRAAAGGEPSPGLAAVTFDDGMANNYEVAFPVLQELGIPATVYVTIGFLGGQSPWIGAAGDGAIMGPAELQALSAAGWELGAHTMTHPDLSKLEYDACFSEIHRSKVALEEIAGCAVNTFAYPFGRYGAPAMAAARDAGLSAAVTTGSGSWDPFELTRAMIGAFDPLSVVLLKLSDRYEPLLASAPMRAIRQASRRPRSVHGT